MADTGEEEGTDVCPRVLESLSHEDHLGQSLIRVVPRCSLENTVLMRPTSHNRALTGILWQLGPIAACELPLGEIK